MNESQEPTLHEGFTAQARLTPHAIAVSCGALSFTYAELDQRSDAIAHELAQRGVAPESVIAIHATRTPFVIAAILGALKAGATYAPLDPSYPVERRTWMLHDCGAKLVLCDSDLAIFQDVPRLDVRHLETVAHAPRPSTSACSAAYVIYTSGSSGRPKGVIVEHHSVSKYIRAFGKELSLGMHDRVLQLGSLGFDLSVEEIFGALLHGATLVLRSDDMLADMDHFIAECERLQLSVLDLPTAFWRELCCRLGTGARLPRCVRAVVIGGERADAASVTRFYRGVASDVMLLNTYGPTEATIAVTWARLTPKNDAEPPIGVPLPHVLAYVVAPNAEISAENEPGELWLGGDCLARGYLGLPELTRERFVENPFAEGRAYRTGDLVVCRPDGQLYFLGRTDHQLKLRGYRIEPEEVEVQLTALPGVQSAVVGLRRNGVTDVLAAYYTGQATPLELARSLRARVPSFLVPSIFIQVNALPLTPNGKVDRDALAQLSAARSSCEPLESHETPLERALCGVFAEVLGLDEVAPDDSPLELGLDSLLAGRVVGLVRSRLERDISLQMLFESPTLRALAARVVAAPHRSGNIARLRRPS